MQSIELEFKMQQLFISTLARVRVLPESLTLLLDDVLALLWKL